MTFDADRAVTAYIRHLYADDEDPACRSRYIRVIVHPTTEHLRDAAHAYDRRRLGSAKPRTFWGDAAGAFQPTPMRARYDRHRRMWVDTTPPFAGIIRLSREEVTPEIVAHESTHAAIYIARLHNWSQPGHDGSLSFTDMPAEERFCYLLGALIPAVQSIVDLALT